MIILDPCLNGVTVWCGDCVSTIQERNPSDLSFEILKRVCYIEKDILGKDVLVQKYPIAIDVAGIGEALYRHLLNDGLKVIPINTQPIDKILPRLI